MDEIMSSKFERSQSDSLQDSVDLLNSLSLNSLNSLNSKDSFDTLGTIDSLKPRYLLQGEVSYADAREDDANILHQLSYIDQRSKFFTHISKNRLRIQSLVASHLGIASEFCHVVDDKDWIHGSFNVCIRVDIGGQEQNVDDDQDTYPEKQLMIRFPLPYRIAESCCPGNSDEKVRCEAGTYAWLEENCKTLPIPQLHGFGLSTGETFTFLDNLPFFPRIFQRLRRSVLSLLGYSTPSNYIPSFSKNQLAFGTPYILIEYIQPSRGRMLAETWEEGRFNPELRKNLFHGLSRTILTMARIPLPKIGSFTLDKNGYLSLSNRALTLDIQQLENEHIPVDIPRSVTHTSIDSYLSDIMHVHENRIRHQPNAVNSIEDGFYQTAALMVMRSIMPLFFRRLLSRGPFFFTLTNMDQTNILVDDNWNIKYLIDLEWACSKPVEMIHPPYWLTNDAIDSVNAEEYSALHAEFMEAFAEEELQIMSPFSLHSILQQGWEKGTFWCSLALQSPSSLFTIFYNYIQPRFSNACDDPSFWVVTMPYWTFNTYDFIEQKVKDKEHYDDCLLEAFQS